MSVRWRALLLVAAASAAACNTFDPRSPPAGRSAKEATCPQKFAACAPPVRYDQATDASRLDLRKQLQITLRMDVPENVAHDAGALVLRRAETADVPGLLQLASIHQDEWATLEKCQCPGETNEWDRRKIGAVLQKRLPPAALRSPKSWEDRMVAPLATIRGTKRQIALRGLAGQPADDLEAALRKADVELCEAVHGARTFLLPDDYAATVEAVRKRRDVEAGPGSAEAAVEAIRAQEKAATCSPAPPAAPAPAAQPAPAPADEDEDEQEQEER